VGATGSVQIKNREISGSTGLADAGSRRKASDCAMASLSIAGIGGRRASAPFAVV
jgi:hypothetical protein